MSDEYACGIVMDRPSGDLYSILGASPDSASWELSELYDKGPKTFERRYAFRALTNRYYRKVYNEYGSTDALYKAGFFLDDLQDDWPGNLMARMVDPLITPVNKIRNHITPFKPMLVLITTGGFSPIHSGHLVMMEYAKQKAEEQGYKVVGGYIAPGHDSYVNQKYSGTAACEAGHRIAMCQIATQDSDWLDVDPWAAEYMPCELNFTDVIDHIKYVLELNFLHEGKQIQVGYVYGSDNAGFGLVVGSLGFEVPRTLISSKKVREGDISHLPPKVAEYYANINKKRDEAPYLIRSEGEDAINHWFVDTSLIGDKPHITVSPEQLRNRQLKFQSTLRFSIKSLLSSCGINLKVYVLDVTEQREKAKQALADRQSISLDAFFKGTYQLESSRIFSWAGSQITPIRRAARLGAKALVEQVNAITPGQYVLVEDDTVTGQTISNAKALLPEGVEIVDQVILSEYSTFNDVDYYDVVDLRDFILGTKHGGLCVEYEPGKVFRVPYAMPFVNLRTRAKIPANALFDLNRIIWQCNVDFFKDSGIVVADCYDGGEMLLACLPWVTSQTTLEHICKVFLELFPI